MEKKTLFILLYLFTLFIFFVHFLIVGKALYGDSLYYYSYLPSFFINHTLNLKTALEHLGISPVLTTVGYAANKYPIGPAIVWSAPFTIVHLLLMPFSLNDGYNISYQLTIGVWSITLVFAGLYFVKKSLSHFFSEKITVLTIITMFLATNLLFYGAIDVINSHSLSFFFASFFFYVWLKKPTFKGATLLGILLSFLMLIRFQDALFALFPLTTLFQKRTRYLSYFAITTIVSLVIFSPQLALWKLIWGNWYKNPYLYTEAFNFLSPQILGVLFNKGSGLFLWTPITALCVFGLIRFASKYKQIGIPSLLFLLAQLFFIASWSTWWQGASYSGRMFVSSLPILSFGLAYIFTQKPFKNIRLIISVFFPLLNIVLIFLFLLRN